MAVGLNQRYSLRFESTLRRYRVEVSMLCCSQCCVCVCVLCICVVVYIYGIKLKIGLNWRLFRGFTPIPKLIHFEDKLNLYLTLVSEEV